MCGALYFSYESTCVEMGFYLYPADSFRHVGGAVCLGCRAGMSKQSPAGSIFSDASSKSLRGLWTHANVVFVADLNTLYGLILQHGGLQCWDRRVLNIKPEKIAGAFHQESNAHGISLTQHVLRYGQIVPENKQSIVISFFREREREREVKGGNFVFYTLYTV